MPGDAFLATAAALVQLAHQHQAQLIVNDRADIARLAGADGGHVGQDDIPPAAVRRIVGDVSIVGVSTHTTTQTKATGYDKVGLEMVREAARKCRARGLPLVAIGGITLENAVSVLEAGAASVAVISDLLTGGDPEARAATFVDKLSRYQAPRV
jgi:thiamine-phosphate pyrophosphorylase